MLAITPRPVTISTMMAPKLTTSKPTLTRLSTAGPPRSSTRGSVRGTGKVARSAVGLKGARDSWRGALPLQRVEGQAARGFAPGDRDPVARPHEQPSVVPARGLVAPADYQPLARHLLLVDEHCLGTGVARRYAGTSRGASGAGASSATSFAVSRPTSSGPTRASTTTSSAAPAWRRPPSPAPPRCSSAPTRA